MAADVVGYSRLMGEDEAGTLAALRHVRSEIFAPIVRSHNGAVVKSVGDGWLVAFDSAADAVTCAIAVQEALVRHETIKLRAGIHVGDVTHADEDVLGDGVNIAARLQEKAEPGAIIISDTARRSIDGKLAADFNDLGPRDLKNIAEAVTVYGWGMNMIEDQTAALAVPDKPSIAVLPFTNMSGDSDQEYFADGIAEDIITALSRIRRLLVVARNTTFTFKGQRVDVQAVAGSLGARYVLEGSVRKAGNRVRVTAQLIHGETGNHLWAEKYDRDLDDVFAIQDEITLTVVSAIEPELSKAEIERSFGQKAENLGAWDYHHRGSASFYRRSREDLAEALRCFARASEIDPKFAPACSGVANALYYNVVFGYSETPNEDRALAIEKAQRAVDLDPDDPFAYAILGQVSYVVDSERGLGALRRSLDLNPSSALTHSLMGIALADVRRFDEAMNHLDEAVRLGERDPTLPQIMSRKAVSQYWAGQFEEAYDLISQVLDQPNAQLWQYYAVMSATLVQLGRMKEAVEAREQMQHVNSGINLSAVRAYAFSGREHLDLFVNDLSLVGLPQ